METMMQERQESSMQEMKGNSFYGEVPQMELTPEDKMRCLFKNQMQVLDEKLEVANANFGRAVRDNNMRWMEKNNLKMECCVLDGQIAILKKMSNDFETLFTSM